MSQPRTKSITSMIKKSYQYITADIDRALLILLTFALPFERIPSFEVFDATIRPSVIIGLVLIVRVAYLLATKKARFSFGFPEKLIIAFMAWLALLVPESININRGVSVLLFNSFTIVLALSVSLLFNKKYIKPIIYSLFLSALGVCLFGLFQYLGNLYGLPNSITGIRQMYSWQVFGFPRIHSMALEPLYFASYLLLPFCAAFCLALDSKQKIISQKLAGSLLFLFSFIIFMTVSRGALYAMAGALLIGSALFAKLKLTSLRQILSSCAVILVGIGLGLLAMNFMSKIPTDTASTIKSGQKGTSAYFEHAKNTSLDDNDGRAMSRQKAIDIVSTEQAVLLLGVGPGQFGPVVQSNIPKGGKWTIVNNLPLELLVETGLVGLLLVVVFIATMIFKGLQLGLSKPSNQTSLFAAIISLYLISQAIQYQSYSTLYVIYIWFPIGLLLGVVKIKPFKK